MPGIVNEGASTITTTYTFATPGIYTVQLAAADQCGGSDLATQSDGLDAMVVVAAVVRADRIVTTDPDDLRRIAEAIGATILLEVL